jgi:branched-chain amino acid transport system permease protein
LVFNIVPFITNFVSFYALYLAIGLSLNLEFGYGGIPNFGKVLFIAGGAAVVGLVIGELAAWVFGVGQNLNFINSTNVIMGKVNTLLVHDPIFAAELVIIALVLAALVGGALGFLASYPAVRLREDYLGLFLLGVAQFFQIVLNEITSSQPLQVPDPYVYFADLGPGVRDAVAALVMSAFAAAVWLYTERTVRSPLGRTLRAVRDNEIAASALGKDTTKARRNALIVASAIAAMAGALYSFSSAYFAYDTWTRFAWTFWPFLIVIMGGVANNAGVAVGAFFFTLLFEGLVQEQHNLQPYLFFNASFLQDLLFAGLLLAILYLRPEGILREKSSFTLPKGLLGKIVGESGGGTKLEPKAPAEEAGISGRLKKLFGRKEGGEGVKAEPAKGEK